MTALSGHIKHVYEDLDLRFRDLKIIIKGLGFCDFDVYEKLDGQNLFVSWDFDEDKLKVARNKQNIKDGGLDRYGLSLKFGDRPKIEALFVGAYDALSKSIGKLGHNMKTQIFGSMGSVWFPVEIINPDLMNTIKYNGKYIVFHEHYPVLFGFDGEPISRGLPRNIEMLKHAIPIMNEDLFEWTIRAPSAYPLMPIDQSIINKACKSIDEIRNRGNIPDGSTIRTYTSERLKSDMQRFPLVPESVRAGLAKSLVKMHGVPSTKSLLDSLDDQTRRYTRSMIEEEKKIILPKILDPIENIIHKFSSSLLSFMKSEYIDNPLEEASRIKNEYDKCCEIIRNGNISKHHNLLSKMEPKVGTGMVTMEGFVFEYNEKLFKITGAFAPMNRIIASIKYENEKRIINPNDVPLSLFVQSG